MAREINLIVTLPGLNFGGFLQAHCLQRAIEEMQGRECFILRHTNNKLWRIELRRGLLSRSPKRFVLNILRMNEFRKDFKSAKFITASSLRDPRVTIKNLILGSDELWNFKSDYFNHYNIYVGIDIPCENKLSYAVSMNTFAPAGILDVRRRAALKQLSAISVRDAASYACLKNNGIDSTICPDPTFLQLNYIRNRAAASNVNTPDRFIAVYGPISRACNDFVRKLSKNYEIPVISVGYYNQHAHCNLRAIGPFDFLGFLSKSATVVTSMFHGLVFSLILGKRFVFENNIYRNNKVSTLVKDLDLEGNIFNENFLKTGIEAVSEIPITEEQKIYKLSLAGKKYLIDHLRA